MSNPYQPWGTPQGFDRYDERYECECGYVDTVPVEEDLSVGAAELLEVPWCDECDKEIEDRGKNVWRA
jgi:hypothetical protein